MNNTEPKIRVGILTQQTKIRGKVHGTALFNNIHQLSGVFQITATDGTLVLQSENGDEVLRAGSVQCIPLTDATVTLYDVIIGKHFHWERKEAQTFHGTFYFLPDNNNTFCVINELGVEQYLESVVSSEMCS